MRLYLVEFARDLRLAATSLRHAAGFTAVAVASLALGFAVTGATTAVVNAFLVRSMPYPHADRLYHVNYAPVGEREPGGMSALDWRSLEAVVEQADYSAPGRFYIGDGADREEAFGLLVAPGSSEMLDVRVVVGRPLRDDDFARDAEQVALIGHDLWRTRFAGDPEIIGRTFRASRSTMAEPAESFRIVGVLPANFRYARTYDRGVMEFAVPLRQQRQAYMVRLREGVPVADAQRAITAAVLRTASSFPPNWNGVRLESVHERYVGGLRPILFAITTASGIVLIIVCVNLAVLMLLRALRRQKEVAVRLALGARRGHIVRMLVAESVLICGAALGVGLAATAIALRVLAPIVEERLGRDAPGGTSAIAIDANVLLIIGGAGVLIALLLSFMPLLAPWQRRLADTLRRVGRSATDAPAMHRVRSALIALEVAASLALLVGCGLMIRTVMNLLRTDLGFRTEQVMRARIALPASTYADPPAFLQFYDQLTQRLAGQPMPFAITNAIPFYEYPQQAIEIDAAAHDAGDSAVLAVSESYFDVLDIALRQGRAFTAADRPNAEPVAIVSETLARRLWPDGSAIGQRIRAQAQEDRDVASVWRTIVGVSNDVRQTHTDTDLDDIYIPFAQTPSRYAPVYVRTNQPPSQWLRLLRTEVAAIDPDVLVTVSTALADEEDLLLAAPRFLMSLLTGFALFAALLATVGIYGVTAYAVQQRERELAIRSAIGATRRQLVLLFVKSGGVVIVAGISAGLFGATAVGRLLRHQLHGVQPLDLSTLAAACAFMTAAGLFATWWPAARAGMNRNPIEVLNDS